jgi:NAD(P)-dependent dehydrogenase (short-subunit alcohol dehydrogenase family)
MKSILILGGNSGIGKETAIDLAKRKGEIFIACRDVKKSKDALEEIKDRSKSSKVHLMELDLASIKSIRNFSKKFHETENRLDILICNAGVMACPKLFTADGFEMQFGVNHLGHFLLTNLLLDLMKTSTPSRIVVVSSEAHRITDINREDLLSEKSYSKLKAYGQSKLANILFARELARRLKNTGVTVNSCHPGLVHTNLGRHMNDYNWIRPFYRAIFKPFYKTAFEGAQTQIRLAVDKELEKISGKYFSDCEEISPSNAAQEDETAAWLWTKSTELIYEKFKDLEKPQ